MRVLVREAVILIAKPKKKKKSRRKKPVRSRGKSKVHLIEPFAHLFGERSDDEIAKLAGVSKSTVAVYRARAGVAGPPRAPAGNDAAPEPAAASEPPSELERAAPEPANAPNAATTEASRAGLRAKRGRRKRSSKIDPFASLVGQVADRVVAEKAGVTVGAVRAYRRTRGIPAARSRAKPVGPTPAAAARQAPATPALTVAPPRKGQLAWRVVLAGRDVLVVLAPTLADAATHAAALGDVQSLERVGPVV